MLKYRFVKFYNWEGKLSGYYAYKDNKRIARIEKRRAGDWRIVADKIQSTKLVISQKFKTLKDAQQRVIKNAEWSERKPNDTNT
jgi:capsule polysaccharide modification protein KpsS